jgi:hypothetical protein
MGYVAFAAERSLHVPFPGDGIFTQALRVFAAIAISLVALLVAALLLRIEEFTEHVRLRKPW